MLFLTNVLGYETPLGLPIQISDIYVPGKEIEPIPRSDRSSSLVIRILKVKPAADGFRYDLEIYGLDPGIHALKKYLHYIHDQSPVTDLQTEISITTTHPLDTLPAPKDIDHTPPKPLGGYRTLMIIGGVLWFLIFLGILFYRKKKPPSNAQTVVSLTLQERLAPLVVASAKGDESSPLILKLEHWLHSPNPTVAQDEISELLMPFRES